MELKNQKRKFSLYAERKKAHFAGEIANSLFKSAFWYLLWRSHKKPSWLQVWGANRWILTIECSAIYYFSCWIWNLMITAFSWIKAFTLFAFEAPQTSQVDSGSIDPRAGKIPWRRKWLPTSVFLPGKSHGQRNLGSPSPWGCRVRHDLSAKQQQQQALGFVLSA